jgi:thiamine biosynthesis protein ThiI
MHGFLVRYGELYLKSSFVRNRFEHILADNIARGLGDSGIKAKTRLLFGRIVIETNEDASGVLERVFGIVSFSPTVICEKKYHKIRRISKGIMKNARKGTFAIRAMRSDKSFPLNSQQLKEKLGDEIRKMGFVVDLTNPEHELCIEIRDKCYIYHNKIPGPGGMPLGTAGRVAAPLKSRDDLLAAFLMMKRGAEAIICNKYDKKLYNKLAKWSVGRKIKTVKNMKEAKRKGAVALLRMKKDGMVSFDPLVGYSNEEKEKLYKTIFR